MSEFVALANPRQEVRDRINYAFGHLVGSFHEGDAHAGDSGDLAMETLTEVGLTDREIDLLGIVAEWVHGNWEYTGKTDDLRRRIERGEV